jgi:DNA-binding HxlR family transcriptional regulator
MKTTEKIKVNLPLIKMLKELENPVRLLIAEHVLNSSPASLTDINECIKEKRGEIGTGILAFHLDILVQTAVLKKTQENENPLYHVPPETMKILESRGLMEADV